MVDQDRKFLRVALNKQVVWHYTGLESFEKVKKEEMPSPFLKKHYWLHQTLQRPKMVSVSQVQSKGTSSF